MPTSLATSVLLFTVIFTVSTSIRIALCLVCYDASIVQRASSAAVPGPISSTSLENNCKVCLTLTVTQEIGPSDDPNSHPIKMIRRSCATDSALSCADNSFTCPFDESTFDRPKFIFNNKPVPVLISDSATKHCECCSTEFCNGPKPVVPIPCNVTKVSDETSQQCIGCMIEQRATWEGQISEITTCQPDGCESYQDKCSSCDPLVYEKCTCSCSINFPKPNYFSTSFVVPNVKPPGNIVEDLRNVESNGRNSGGYELSDAQRSSALSFVKPHANFSHLVIAAVTSCFFMISVAVPFIFV